MVLTAAAFLLAALAQTAVRAPFPLRAGRSGGAPSPRCAPFRRTPCAGSAPLTPA
jgi:hypothetical protein